MIDNRRIYLNDDETERIKNGKCVNREIRGVRWGELIQLKIIPKKMDFNPRPFAGRPISDKDWELIDE